jgi:hypothetical protein
LSLGAAVETFAAGAAVAAQSRAGASDLPRSASAANLSGPDGEGSTKSQTMGTSEALVARTSSETSTPSSQLSLAQASSSQMGQAKGELSLHSRDTAADAVEARLMMHTEFAQRNPTSGALTDRQVASLAKTPEKDVARQFGAFYGNNLDDAVKRSVMEDPWCWDQGVIPTPRAMVGPDFLDANTGQWYDLTTPGKWPEHLRAYGPGGTAIWYQAPTRPR